MNEEKEYVVVLNHGMLSNLFGEVVKKLKSYHLVKTYGENGSEPWEIKTQENKYRKATPDEIISHLLKNKKIERLSLVPKYKGDLPGVIVMTFTGQHTMIIAQNEIVLCNKNAIVVTKIPIKNLGLLH